MKPPNAGGNLYWQHGLKFICANTLDNTTNSCLKIDAAMSGIAALLHLGCIMFSPAWYRFCGAGEGMAQLAAAGIPVPTEKMIRQRRNP